MIGRVLAAALAAAVLGVSACGGEPASGDGYNAELRSEFVVNCVAQGTPQDQCGCFYDKLEDKIPFSRYVEIEEEIRAGSRSIPDDVALLAAACAADPTS